MVTDRSDRSTLHRGPPFDVRSSSPLPGVFVVTASDEIDTATAPRLHRELADVASEQPAHVILDLRAVTFFCGAGVRSLMAARTAAAEGPFELHLTGVTGNRPVAVVLDALRLTDRFRIHPTLHAALAAAGGDVLDR